MELLEAGKLLYAKTLPNDANIKFEDAYLNSLIEDIQAWMVEYESNQDRIDAKLNDLKNAEKPVNNQSADAQVSKAKQTSSKKNFMN